MKKLLILLVGPVLTGCSSEADKDEVRRNSVTVLNSGSVDDASAMEALSDVGAKIRKNSRGQIIEVNLRKTKANDETLKALVLLQHGRSLLLNDLNITDVGLATLSEVSWPVTQLDLRGCPISNAGLEHLAGMSSLKVLRLSGSNAETSVNDEGLATISRFTGLRVLSLDKLTISVAGIKHLIALQELEELYLADTTIDDEAVKILSGLTGLQKLRLSGNPISDEGLKQLAKLENLVDLDLSRIDPLSDDGIEHLSGLTRLKKLNLWRVPIGDSGVKHLIPLTKLEWLNLDNTNLSDDGLSSLSNMKQLRFLHVGSTRVSDAGLPLINNHTALKDLIVTRTLVTKAGVAELKKRLPVTRIQLEYTRN